MSAPIQANLQSSVRDINIRASDSCNCCCAWGRMFRPNPQVYVDDRGIIREWDPLRTQNEMEAMAASIRNLERIIRDLSEFHKKDPDQIVTHVNTHIIALRSDIPSPIKMNTIHRILDIIER